MKKITIVDGHPDPCTDRLNHALATRYASEAEAAGACVRRIDLAGLEIPVLRTEDDFVRGAPSEIVAQAQQDIAWADHVVMFYPLWMFAAPALFKAFVEQVFRPAFAVPRGKTARVVVTMGMPALVYRLVFREHGVKSLTQGLQFKGMWRVSTTLIGNVGTTREKTHDRWIERITALARRDAARRPRLPMVLAGAALGAGLVGAYAGIALAAWTRYGRASRGPGSNSLLESVMPDYEVRIEHHVEIDAPAELAFEAICGSDFSRSPTVRALFRAREIVMHAKRATPEAPVARGLVKQFTEMGWTVLGQVAHREVAFGTATKPWEPNPVMHALPPERFKTFADPDYARVAFTVRVDPLSPARCIARTETRVQTTDDRSRAKFRWYWSFLSPGIALVRLALLQQMKKEAEASWRALRIGV